MLPMPQNPKIRWYLNSALNSSSEEPISPKLTFSDLLHLFCGSAQPPIHSTNLAFIFISQAFHPRNTHSTEAQGLSFVEPGETIQIFSREVSWHSMPRVPANYFRLFDVWPQKLVTPAFEHSCLPIKIFRAVLSRNIDYKSYYCSSSIIRCILTSKI